MKINKLIHVIWAGGKRIMPRDNLETVAKWANANKKDKFKVYFWVDSKTTSSEILKKYVNHKIFKKNNLVVKELSNEFTTKKEFDIILKDINELSLEHSIRYELDRLRPNYGCSSDALRYKIIYKYGGVYTDSDNNPGEISLNYGKMFDEDDEELQLLFYYPYSQNSQYAANDFFISSAGHPFFKKLNDHIQTCYATAQPDYDIRTYWYNNSEYKKNYTISLTGPKIFRKLLKGLKNTKKLAKNYLTPYEENTCHWLKSSLKYFLADNHKELFCVLKNTIIHEAKFMHMLRFDDHVKDLNEILEVADSEKKVLEIIIQLINEKHIQIKTITFPQMISIFSNYNKFVKNNFQHNFFNLYNGLNYISVSLKEEKINENAYKALMVFIANHLLEPNKQMLKNYLKKDMTLFSVTITDIKDNILEPLNKLYMFLKKNDEKISCERVKEYKLELYSQIISPFVRYIDYCNISSRIILFYPKKNDSLEVTMQKAIDSLIIKIYNKEKNDSLLDGEFWGRKMLLILVYSLKSKMLILEKKLLMSKNNNRTPSDTDMLKKMQAIKKMKLQVESNPFLFPTTKIELNKLYSFLETLCPTTNTKKINLNLRK